MITVRETKSTKGKEQSHSGRVLFMCSGYYDYEEGHLPEFPGIENFKGTVVHPQHWSASLDYQGKKVAVIGSGATAVTLVPAMADDAAKVTMIQRSPTYVVSRPGTDKFANLLNKFLPDKLAYRITRWRNIRFQDFVYSRSRTNPGKLKHRILQLVRKDRVKILTLINILHQNTTLGINAFVWCLTQIYLKH